MSQPVKLSNSLVLDARLAGNAMDRSIAGQVEFWARLGKCLEMVLEGGQVMALQQAGGARPLAECLETADSVAGRERLAAHLAELPFPRYEPHPHKTGLLVRTDAAGKRATGRFVNREFVETPVTRRMK
jgi:hypothetical protein